MEPQEQSRLTGLRQLERLVRRFLVKDFPPTLPPRQARIVPLEITHRSGERTGQPQISKQETLKEPNEQGVNHYRDSDHFTRGGLSKCGTCVRTHCLKELQDSGIWVSRPLAPSGLTRLRLL